MSIKSFVQGLAAGRLPVSIDPALFKPQAQTFLFCVQVLCDKITFLYRIRESFNCARQEEYKEQAYVVAIGVIVDVEET